MPNDDTEITPRLLLEHMQAMQASLASQIQSNHVEVKGEIARLERKIDTLTLGMDSIDARLDAIEIEKLPQRVRALEMKR